MPFTAKGYLERGIERLNKNDSNGAMEDLNEAIRRSQDFADAYYYRALLKFKLQQWSEAFEDTRLAIQFKKSSYQEALDLQLKCQQAITEYNKRLRLQQEKIARQEAIATERLRLQQEEFARQKAEKQLHQRRLDQQQQRIQLLQQYNQAKLTLTQLLVLEPICVATLIGHSSSVWTLTVLPDGRFASGSADSSIKIWDLNSYHCFATLNGHSDQVYDLILLPDGRLASGSFDNSIKIWDLNSYNCVATLNGHSKSVFALTVLPDGRIASGSWDHSIKIWNLNSYQCVATLNGHSNPVLALTTLPDGRISSGALDNSIKIWDLNSYKCVATLIGHSSCARALTMLPDGRFASGSKDESIKIWDLNSYKCVATLIGHSSSVWALTVLPDGRFASGSADKSIKIWDLQSESCVTTLNGHSSSVNALTVLPDGRIASGSEDKSIKIWDLGFPQSQDIPSLLEILQKNTTITEVNLAGISLHDSGAKALAELIRQNHHLQQIDCSNTGLTDVDAQILLPAVEANSDLLTLSMERNPIQSELLQRFQAIFRERLAMHEQKRLEQEELARKQAETERLKREQTELARKQAAELERQRHQQEQEAKKRAAEAERLKHEQEELARIQAAELVLQRRQQEQEAKKRAAEAERLKREQEELARIQAAELERQRRQQKEEEARKRAAEAERLRREQEELAKKQAAELERQRRQQEEEAKKRVEAERLRLEQEELARKQALAEKIRRYTESAAQKLQADNFIGAIADYDQLLLLTPKDAEAFRNRGAAKSELKNYHAAIEDFEKAIALKLGDYPAAVNLLDIARRKLAESPQSPPPIKPLPIPEKPARTAVATSPTSFSIIPYAHLQFSQHILGIGGFGEVHQATWKYIDVAVKQLKASRLTEKALQEFKSEAERHGSLRHLNIVNLYGVCLDPGKYCMVMELMPKGSLHDLLHNMQPLDWNLRISIAKDICVGLAYLHEQQIIHRDLKSLNVLLDDRMRAKLCDFGLSQVKAETASSKTGAATTGTLAWMAPELFARNSKCSKASDIYALAVTLWELASRKIPFANATNPALIGMWVSQGEREEIPTETPPQMSRLISRCWAQRAEERLEIQQIVAEIMTLQPSMGDENTTNATAASAANLESGYRAFSQ